MLGTINIFDSLSTDPRSHQQTSLVKLPLLLTSLSHHSPNKLFACVDRLDSYCGNMTCPQQNQAENTDCGIFPIFAAKHLLENQPLQHYQHANDQQRMHHGSSMRYTLMFVLRHEIRQAVVVTDDTLKAKYSENRIWFLMFTARGWFMGTNQVAISHEGSEHFWYVERPRDSSQSWLNIRSYS